MAEAMGSRAWAVSRGCTPAGAVAADREALLRRRGVLLLGGNSRPLPYLLDPAVPPIRASMMADDAARAVPAEAAMTVNGVTLWGDIDGALWWPERRALIVADLHLEKGSGLARRGSLLPPYDTVATLDRLAAAVARRAPERVICLGDTFHDARGPERLGEPERARLERLAQGCAWIWVLGNHDRAAAIPWGTSVPEHTVPPLVFRHEAVPGGRADVSGHFHPRASVRARGACVSARCFVGDGNRLMLPAFGSYTGGLDVLDPAIRRLLAPRFSAFLLGRERIHRIPVDGRRLSTGRNDHAIRR